jgi:hypothetical protein
MGVRASPRLRHRVIVADDQLPFQDPASGIIGRFATSMITFSPPLHALRSGHWINQRRA